MNMLKYITVFLLVFLPISSHGQSKYFTREGHIHFISETPIETIESNNYKVNCVVDFETGQIQFAALIKAFEFKKALMEEHFNENYMESDLHPKATFKGTILNFESVDLTSDGDYEVEVEGDLTIHGVTKQVKVPGKILVSNGIISAAAVFKVMVEDYNIDIPKVVIENIAEEITISVNMDYQKLVRN